MGKGLLMLGQSMYYLYDGISVFCKHEAVQYERKYPLEMLSVTLRL